MAQTLLVQWLNEMHASGEQAFAKVKALGERHVQAGIEHQMRTTILCRLASHRVEQLRAYAVPTLSTGDNQIVDIDEPAIEQVFQRPEARQTDQLGAQPGPQQAIMLVELPRHLNVERRLSREMRP